MHFHSKRLSNARRILSAWSFPINKENKFLFITVKISYCNLPDFIYTPYCIPVQIDEPVFFYFNYKFLKSPPLEVGVRGGGGKQ